MALRWNDEARTLALGVADLVDAAARSLDRELAMSTRARLLWGQRTHARVRQGWEDAEAEVGLTWTGEVRGWTCTVRGRADGLAVEDGRTVIEEVKSTALDADRLDAVDDFPEWREQLLVYLWLANEARHADPVGRLRVVSLVDGSQRLWTVAADPERPARVRARLERWVYEREEALWWRARRRAEPVRFPHAEERPGQAELGRAVEEGLRAGGQVLLCAPTGLGKTAAVLTAALRVGAEQGWGVYWATARSTQQYLVETTARATAALGTPLRAVTLRPRAEVCLNGVVDCRPAACRHADGYEERRRVETLDPLVALGLPGPLEVRALGEATTLCPYALALDWGARCDLVVGDYNYVFDPAIHVRRLLGERPMVVVVDEAHQLADRAVGYGSPALALGLAEAVIERCRGEAWAALRELATAIRDEVEEAGLRGVLALEGATQVELVATRWADLRSRVDEVALDHARLRLSDPVAAPGEPDPWTELGRAVIRFADTLERAGEETVALWDPAGLRLVCLDPAPLLRRRLQDTPGAVFMSATLRPDWYWRDRLGLEPDRARLVSVPSPFPPEHRRVIAVPGVSTAYRHRERDRARIAELLGRTIRAVPGNVAVYFGSYEELRAYAFAVDPGGHAVLMQAPDASEAERRGLYATMVEPGPPRVLYAVLGGVWAEGVDLPGGALRAVVLVGPALPPPTVERALQQAWYAQRYEDPFDLTYVLPGMTRVVQAAGRVVRRAEDRGVVVLLCQRFLRRQFAAYLPAEWVVTKSSRPWEDVGRFLDESGYNDAAC